MENIVYVYYIILIGILLYGTKLYGRHSFNEAWMSFPQTKALQGFFAICIMFHHVGQKTCADWLDPRYIVHGLDVFVPIGYYFVGIFLFCSGYGLYKSYEKKPNYLQGFFTHRMLPVILSFYSTGIIFLAVRFLMGQQMTIAQVLIYISGLQLCNPNAWFVIALPIFYLIFYFAFKHCKNEKQAVVAVCTMIFIYTLIGTMTDHNNWWMCGQWWYNTAHFFCLGLIFARYEQSVEKNIKKHYMLYMVLLFIGIFAFYYLSQYTELVVSYYGEDYNLNFKVLRRWICLLSQIAASCSFVFFVFMLGLKIKIGNKLLAFMGTITLEFYLIHGLFIELFGYSFLDMRASLYYIRNVTLFVAVVVILGIPAALLVKKLDKWLISLLIKARNAVCNKSSIHKEC